MQRWCRRLFGIAVAAFATGPAALALVFVHDLVSDQAWEALLVRFRNWDLGRIPLGLLQVAAWAAPFVVVHALVMLGLRRLRSDSLIFAGASGGLVTCLRFFGVLGRPEETNPIADILLAFGLGAVIGTIYWVVVNRVERRQERDQQREIAAIRAMD